MFVNKVVIVIYMAMFMKAIHVELNLEYITCLTKDEYFLCLKKAGSIFY